MKRNNQYWIRKVHRYLGLVIGIQFGLWTLGGLYFSWSDMDEIHGDLHRKPTPLLSLNKPFVSPQVFLDSIKRHYPRVSLVSLQLMEVFEAPHYQLIFKPDSTHAGHQVVHLFEASSGHFRPPLTQEEAVALAQSRFHGAPQVEQVTYLKQVSTHHEYRGGPLPAYAIHFAHPSRTTVYVATELGSVQKFRNEKWRVFDFLWMLHTMDYQGRDDITNGLLRFFSILGLLTILSGFLLFFSSSSQVRKWRKRRINS